MKCIYYSLFAALILISCKDKTSVSETKPVIEEVLLAVIQPIKALNPEEKHFTVSAEKKDTILLANGGSIIFLENAFIDENGNQITGEVDIEWQEFHSLGDIFASGIPMKYDSAGVQNNLVSGGMFTINASQKGTEVKMAKDKPADVNLVSMQDTPCYNFYELDEKSGDWNYETTKEGEKVKEAEISASVRKETILDVDVNTHHIARLNGERIVGWKTTEKISNRNKRFFEQRNSKCTVSEIEGSDKYLLEIRVSTTSKTMKVTPYLYSEALADSKNNKKALKLETNEIEMFQRDVAMGKIVRNISIRNFGTFNWDIVCTRSNPQMLFADFEFPDGVNPRLVTLALVSPDENAIVNYNAEGDDNFSFDPKLRNCLIAILPTNELLVVRDAGFNNARKAANKSEYTFTFEKTGVILSSTSELDQHIDALI